jgi:hypothetical protein
MSTIRSKDRASLCTFTFADGRRCRSPRSSGHPHLCYSHALKQSQASAGVAIGNRILNRLSGSYLSACDLTNALGQIFSGVAQGSIKRKTAGTLAYLGQTMVNSIQLAQDEYINAFGTNQWRNTIYSSVTSAQQNDADEDDSADAADESDAAQDNAAEASAETKESPQPATSSAK